VAVLKVLPGPEGLFLPHPSKTAANTKMQEIKTGKNIFLPIKSSLILSWDFSRGMPVYPSLPFAPNGAMARYLRSSTGQ
jgi:hypothetical protein